MKFFLLIIVNLILSIPIYSDQEENKPLLRVFPIYRAEECEWAIRWDVCLSCMRQGQRYAQKILFLTDGHPFRVHGCYTNQKGFIEWDSKQLEK
jgi:hypothetical protein